MKLPRQVTWSDCKSMTMRVHGFASLTRPMIVLSYLSVLESSLWCLIFADGPLNVICLILAKMRK